MPSFEYPHGRIARAVEKKAGKEFGPAKLSREDIASSLYISPELITEEEWAEIYEFSVNAGAELRRSAIRKDVPGAVASDNIEKMLSRIKENDDGLFAIHDIFHAAETYRLTRGKHASAEFIQTDKRGRYTNPAAAAAELYPVLFLVALPGLDKPFPLMLANKQGRRVVSEFLKDTLDASSPEVQEAVKKLRDSEPPETSAERKQEYESLIELIVINNAIQRLSQMEPAVLPLTEGEKEAIHLAIEEATKNPASHYQQFAEKVFSRTDWPKDSRLFLDELLTCIRSFQP